MKSFLAYFVFVLVFSTTGAGQMPATDSADALSSFSVALYPSPVRTMIKLKVDGVQANEILLFELIDVSGMVVYSKSVRTTGPTTVKKIQRPPIDGGLYYYRVLRKSNGQMVRGQLLFH